MRSMLSNKLPAILRSGFAAGMLMAGVSTASAWERLGFASYGGSGNYAGASVYTRGYGFGGGPVASGYETYEPRLVPHSTDLVPPAWGYGVYGVPSATGIAKAPAARPTVYVIDRPAAGRREGGRARILSRRSGGDWGDARGSDTGPGGARIVSVTVPRR